MGAFSDYVSADAPAAPAAPDETLGDFSGGLRRGLRSGGAAFNRVAGTAAEAMGFDGFARGRIAAAQAADAENAADPAKVSTYKDVIGAPDFSTGLRRAVDYGSNMLGESVPALGAMAVGGALGGMRGAAAGMLPFSMGDVAARQEADPVASQESAGLRLGKQALFGGADAALNTIVPASVASRMFGKAATAAAQLPVSQILGRVGADAVAQGAAGAAGEAVKQVGVNPTKTLDMDQIGEVAVGGTALGAAMGGVGAAGTLARKAAGAPGRAVGGVVDAVGASAPVKALKDAVGPEGYDLGGKASAALGAASDKASALMPGADGGIDLGGIAKGLQDSLSSAKKSGRAFLDRVAAGDVNATVDEAAYVGKTPDEVRAMQPEQDRTRVAKLREIGAGLMAQAGDLSEQARTQLAQAMNNIEDPRAQAVVARVKKGADAVAEWSADVASSAKLFAAGLVDEARGVKKSEDYSGLRKQVMEPVLAVMREARPELFETGEWRTQKGMNTLNQVASIVRMTLDHVNRASPLSPDKLLALIYVFGDRAADVISSSYEAVHGNADKAGTAELFRTLKALDDVADQNKDLTEALRGLQDDSRDWYPLSEYQLKQHTQWLRAYAGRSARAEVAGKSGVQMTLEKAQADYHDARIHRMLDSFYGKNKDKVLAVVEADRKATERMHNQFDDGTETVDGADRQLSDEVLSEDADPTKRKPVAQTPDPVYRGEGGKDEFMLLAPEKAVGKGGFASATQQAIDAMTARYPDRNVTFLRASEIGDHPAKTATLNKLIEQSFKDHPEMSQADRLKLANEQLKDYGFVVAEGSRQETSMTERDLKGVKLKRPEGSSADYKHPSRIDVGGEVLDAIKLSKWAEARNKDVQDYSNADNKSGLHRAGRMFMEGLAAAHARIGKPMKSDTIPDATQIGWHADGKTPLTWGEVKDLKYGPAPSAEMRSLQRAIDEAKKAGDTDLAQEIHDQFVLMDQPEITKTTDGIGVYGKDYNAKRTAELKELRKRIDRFEQQINDSGSRVWREKSREILGYMEARLERLYREDSASVGGQKDTAKLERDPFGNVHEALRGRGELRASGEGLDVKVKAVEGESLGDTVDIGGAEIRTNLTGNSRQVDEGLGGSPMPRADAGRKPGLMSDATKQMLIDKVKAMQRNYTTAAGQAVAKRALALMDRIDSLPPPAHRALVSLLAKGTKMSDVAEVVNRLMPEKVEPKPVERRTPEVADKAKRDAVLDKMLAKEDYSALTTTGKTNAFLKRAYERYGELMAMGDAKWDNPAFDRLAHMFDPGTSNMDLASLFEDFDGIKGGGMTDAEIRAKLKAAAPEVAANLPKAGADRQAAVRAGPEAEAALDQANYSSMTKKFSKMGLQVHTELGRDGFAATHDSPVRHDGRFDWRSHAGKGEGNASFGAGTYLSTSDGTHKAYKKQFTARASAGASRHPAVKAAREALDNASDDVIFLMQERDELGPWRADVGRSEHFASKAEAQAALDKWAADRRAKIAGYAEKLRAMDSPGGPKYNRTAIHEEIAYLEGKLRDEAGNKPVDVQAEIDAATERRREAQAHYDEVKSKYAGEGYRGDKSPTYEVSVSIGEDSLLDWNKPLSGQHPKVQEKLRAAGIDIAPRNDWLGFVLDPNGVDEYMQHADELSRLVDTASPELADRVFEAATTAFDRRTEMRGPDYSDRWGETKDLKRFPAELIEELRAVKSDGAAKAMEAFNEALDWRDAGKDLGAAYRAQEASASTGGQAYRMLQKKLGSQRAASEALQAAGILGNVHDAQFGGEKQFRNYVIYDDSKITTNYVHFDKTNSNPNASPRTAQQDAALNAYFDKVLGPTIARDLNANIPHAGEFVKAGTQHLINISRFAMDPWGTGHHEALHSFFASMREASPTGEVARVLERAASSAPVMNQLRRLLKDHPEALKQLSDPEEAAAYMYQFWAAKKLTVGTQTHTIFSRIAAAVRRVLGIWSNDERALHILDYFHRGDFAVDRGQPDVVAQKLLLEHRNILVDQAAKLTKPLRELSSSVAVAGGQQLRDSGIPALAQLADVIKLHGTSEGKDPGYMPAARAEHTRVMNEVMDKLAPFTAAQMREALDAMQQGVKAASKEARQIQLLVQNPKVGLLPKMREYMGNAGVDVSQFGPDPTYFHRVWDTGFIAAHEKEFMAMLGKYQISGDLKGDPRVILQNLMATDGLEFRVETNMPGMQALKMRKLGFITGADAEPFLRKDLLENLNSYVQQATRRAEWARRLGDQGEGLQDLLTKAAKQGATPEQLAVAQRYVKSIDGTLGDTIDPKYRRLFGNMMVYQNIRLLPLAIFSSLPDSLGIMVRGGTVAESGRAFLRGMREIRKNFQKEGGKNDAATDLAELIGTIDSSQLMHTIGTSYSQGMVGNTGRRVNDLFFRFNFMDQYNRSMRVAATEAAINFIKRHADGKANKHSERWLAEIGLEAGAVKLDAEGRPDVTDPDVRMAINRWVDGAVLRPDAADAPPWMADPRAALIAHLKKFTFSFQETILKRVAHEYRHGNYAPAMALTSYVPMMLAADMAKGIIQGGGEEPDWKAGWDVGDYLGHAVQRAGLFGVGQFALDTYQGAQRDGPLGALGALGGPTVGQLTDGVEMLAGTQRPGTFLLNSMPANALYSGMARDSGGGGSGLGAGHNRP